MNHMVECLTKLANILATPEGDFWYDIGSEDARKLLDQGGEPLLEQILVLLPNWNLLQQEHLAYILGGSNSHAEMKLLDILCGSSSSEVAFRARESIRNIHTRRIA